MHRYSEVVGLPVVCADSGKNAGYVKDIVSNPGQREVMAFLLEHKGMYLKKKVVPLKNVLNLGRDAVIVDNATCVACMGRSEYLEMFANEGGIMGLHIFSRAGDELGVIKDAIFDWKTGRIECVEISDGILQDIVQGRKLLPLVGRVEFSKENLLVDGEAVEEMHDTGGGIRKRLFG